MLYRSGINSVSTFNGLVGQELVRFDLVTNSNTKVLILEYYSFNPCKIDY